MTRRTAKRSRNDAIVARPPEFLRSSLRTFGVALVCAKVALVPVVFDHDADVAFTVVKAGVSHAIAYVLTAVMVGLIVQFGRSFLIRSPVHLPVLAFLGASVAATVVASDPILGLYGAHDRMVGLGTIADGVALYFAIVLLIRTRTEAIAVAASFLGASAIMLAYELLQFIGRDPLTWSVDSAARPFSTIGQTTNLAEYLVVVAVGTAAFGLLDATLRTSLRGLLLALAGVALVWVLVTQTRSSLIGLVSGAAVLVILVWRAYPNKRARRFTILAGAGAGAVFALVLLFTPLGARLLSTVEISAAGEGDSGPHLEQSADVRVALYRASIDMVRDRPLFGYGPDNFLAAFPAYRSEDEPFEVQESPNTSAHGWIAQVAATGGLAGLITFIAIAAATSWVTFRNGFRPLAWAALGMLFAFLGAGLTTVNAVSTDWLFWFAAGVVAVATGQPWVPASEVVARTSAGRSYVEAQNGERTLRRGLGMATVGLGLLLVLTILGPLDASRAARASQVARLQGRAQQSIDLGLRATRADPQRAQYWDTLGLAYVGGDRFKDASSAFDRASALAPYDVRYYGDLARAYVVLIQRGDKTLVSPARDIAERVVRVDPNNPLANQTRAVVMMITNDLPEALKSVERALALDKSNNAEIYLTKTQVLSGLGRPADAIASARFGITRIPNPLNQIQIRIELVRALVANGQLSDALTEVDALLGIQPNQPMAQQLKNQIQAALAR